jgi:hypothetical protein
MNRLVFLVVVIIISVALVNSIGNDLSLSHANQVQDKLEYQLHSTQLELLDLYAKHNLQQENTVIEITKFEEELSTQKTKLNTINQEYLDRIAEIEFLVISLEKPDNVEPNLLKKITGLESRIIELEYENQISSNFDQSLEIGDKLPTKQSFTPSVTMTEQTISWEFTDSKNNKYSFSKHSDDFIDDVVLIPSPQDTLTVALSGVGLGGSDLTQEIRDLSPFVKGSMPFVMNRLHENVQTDHEFISEIWWIISQFDVTSFEMQDTPQKPLDTFSKGEGDNEDLAILMADMIKSSEVGKTWDLRFIYYDSDDPSTIAKINHVALIVITSHDVWLIEPTAKTIDDVFQPRDSIRGNMFEI